MEVSGLGLGCELRFGGGEEVRRRILDESVDNLAHERRGQVGVLGEIRSRQDIGERGEVCRENGIGYTPEAKSVQGWNCVRKRVEV